MLWRPFRLVWCVSRVRPLGHIIVLKTTRCGGQNSAHFGGVESRLALLPSIMHLQYYFYVCTISFEIPEDGIALLLPVERGKQEKQWPRLRAQRRLVILTKFTRLSSRQAKLSQSKGIRGSKMMKWGDASLDLKGYEADWTAATQTRFRA